MDNTENLTQQPQETLQVKIRKNQIIQAKEQTWTKKRFILFFTMSIFLLLVCGSGIYLFKNAQKKLNLDNKQDKIVQSTNNYTKNNYSSPRPLVQLKEVESPDTKGKILFVSEGEIWTINSDSTNLKQLTKDENNKFHISMSLDAKKIAYSFFPKDDMKRNRGYYVGYFSGVAIFNIDTNETKILIPYEYIQNHYPVWSPDNKYLSVWIGNGIGSKLIDISSTDVVLNLTGTKDNYVSPIVWIPLTNKVSFIENKNLVTFNLDDSNRQILATGVDSLRMVHEGPNVPQPPSWSPSGRYVTFYKSGDLYLMDVINNTEVIVEKGKKSEMFDQIYPQAFPVGFNSDETMLYMYNSAKEKDTVVLDIKTGQLQEIAMLGQSIIMSPDKREILGKDYEKTPKIVVINLSNNTLKECPGKFNYSYYSWAGGTGYSFRFDTWSPDNSGILGYRESGKQGLNILNVKDCSVFNLTVNKSIIDAIWFPN